MTSVLLTQLSNNGEMLLLPNNMIPFKHQNRNVIINSACQVSPYFMSSKMDAEAESRRR